MTNEHSIRAFPECKRELNKYTFCKVLKKTILETLCI